MTSEIRAIEAAVAQHIRLFEVICQAYSEVSYSEKKEVLSKSKIDDFFSFDAGAQYQQKIAISTRSLSSGLQSK